MENAKGKCNYKKKSFYSIMYEKIVMLFLLGIIIFSLLGPSVAFAVQPLDIKFVLNEKLEPGYFIKIEETAENHWTIKAISNLTIKREQRSEEILYLNLNNMQVQPYYEHYSYNRIHGDFRCTSTGEKVIYGETDLSANKYSPCNSALTRMSASVNSILETAVSLGIAAGSNKTLDKEKIGKICEQTNLVAKVKECSEFMNKIIIDPRIIDESGLHSDANFFEVDKNKCTVESGNLKCPITISSKNENLSVVIEPESYNLKYDTNGYSLKPVVKILSKKFDTLHPKSIFEDQFVAIKLNKISVSRSLFAFDIDIQNKSENYVSIESVSFYINESIITPRLTQMELLPKSYKNNIRLSLSPSTKEEKEVFQSARKSIRTDITKYNADKVFITLGISSKYKMDNDNKSLFKSKQHNFSSLLNIEEGERLAAKKEEARLEGNRPMPAAVTVSTINVKVNPANGKSTVVAPSLNKEAQLAEHAWKQPKKNTTPATVKSSSQSSDSEINRDGRFIAYSNGTVLDTRTNLMWAAKDNGRELNWASAKSYCNNYRAGGYSDWRMPTQNELAGLYDKSKGYTPACAASSNDGKIYLTNLINMSCWWGWASDTRGSEAALFSFGNGTRNWRPHSDGGIRALPVRSGK